MNHSTNRAVFVMLVIFLICGCAGQRPAHTEDGSEPGTNRTGHLVARRSAAVAQGGLLLARSVPVDPINRPVSNIMSLSSYALKSATGFLQRVAIGTAPAST